MVRRSNPCGSEVFRTTPDLLWGPRSLLYNGHRVSFPGVKRPGRGVDNLPQSSAEVEEKVGLYIYSPSGPSRPVLGEIYFYCCVKVLRIAPSTVYSQVATSCTKNLTFKDAMYYPHTLMLYLWTLNYSQNKL